MYPEEKFELNIARFMSVYVARYDDALLGRQHIQVTERLQVISARTHYLHMLVLRWVPYPAQ